MTDIKLTVEPLTETEIFSTRPSATARLPFNQVVNRLAGHTRVKGLMVLGSAGAGRLADKSDYDLLVVLDELPPQVSVALTTINGRLTDLIFASLADLEQLLALRRPLRPKDPGGMLLWLFTGGKILHDPTGQLRRVRQKARSGEWLRFYSPPEAYQAWFSTNFNLAHTRRLLQSPDPFYQVVGETRMAIYGSSELFWTYFTVRGIEIRGDKAAVRYLSENDPDYLRRYYRFLKESDRGRKLALYEELVEAATGPAGGRWETGITAFQMQNNEELRPEQVAEALDLWENLIAEQDI